MNRLDNELGLNSKNTDFQNVEGDSGLQGGCPDGMTWYGDGSACVDSTGTKTCAVSGNIGKPRCVGFKLTPNVVVADKVVAGKVVAGADTKSLEEDKKGLSTGAMIGIGVGVLVLVGGMLLMRKK